MTQRTIQLAPEAAELAKFLLLEQASALKKAADKARARAHRNLVAAPAETFVADALERAVHTLMADRTGINPTLKGPAS